jgi:hypothetical protein
MKRTLTLLLAVLSVISLLAACAEGGDAGTDVAETTAETTTEAETTEYTANIPTDFDFGGYNFRIYAYPDPASGQFWCDYDFSYTEETGDALSDAAYRRMRAVEDQLGIKFSVYNASAIDGADLRKTITSDDYAYDLSCISPRGSATLSQSNYLVDLKSMTKLDLDAPWWDQNCVNDLSINNKLYMIVGDIAIAYKKSIAIILFNKEMAADYKIEDPYALMASDTWTIDKFTTMARNAAADLNNDGKYDDTDRYGLNFYCNFIANGMIASGVKFVTKNEQDLPTLTFMSDKTVSIWEKYTALFYDTATCYSWSRNGKPGTEAYKMFIDNRALFYFNEFHAVETLRQMETDFGILPIPKYDEAQERYYHCINPHVAEMISVPIYNSNLELTAYVMDSLGANSKNILTPAYNELQLKTKGSRDDQSEASIDIILNSLTYDMGYIFDWGTVGQFTLTLVDAGKTDLVSSYKKIEKTIDKQMNKAIENYLAIENG